MDWLGESRESGGALENGMARGRHAFRETDICQRLQVDGPHVLGGADRQGDCRSALWCEKGSKMREFRWKNGSGVLGNSAFGL